MSLKITSVPAASKEFGGRKLDPVNVKDARVSKTKSEKLSNGQPETQKTNTPLETREKLRFELSTLNRESVKAQKDVSFHQVSLSGLEQLERDLEKLEGAFEDKPAREKAVANFRKTVENTSFEEKPVLKSKDEEETPVQPVVVQRPPKLGEYSVKIFKRSESPESLSFTIKVGEQGEKEKSIKTSVSPATGLIEGVELYFELGEEIKEVEQEIQIKDEPATPFPVPSFERDAKALEKAVENDAPVDDLVRQASRKIESTRNGLTQSLQDSQDRFQGISNTQENLKAAQTDPSSASSAFESLKDVNSKLNARSESAADLFSPKKSSLSQDLFE